MREILLYIWQLPQNLLGLIVLLFIRNETRHSLCGITFYLKKGFPGGISLGRYIILGYEREHSVKHEYGHSIQSKILGWLYLPVVGLSSVLHACFHDCAAAGKSYYHFWTEAWANRLMKIK